MNQHKSTEIKHPPKKHDLTNVFLLFTINGPDEEGEVQNGDATLNTAVLDVHCSDSYKENFHTIIYIYNNFFLLN